EEPGVFYQDRRIVFLGCFLRRELGYFTKAGALDFGFRGSEHADLYLEWVEDSAGFLVLVVVLCYEPDCSFIGWRSICLSWRSPRLSEGWISPSPRRQPHDSPWRLF